MDVSSYGFVGRLEAARQALEEAGEKGLYAGDLLRAAGMRNSGGASTQSFLAQLTSYCAIYENDSGRKYFLNEEMDVDFVRRIWSNTPQIDEDEEEGVSE